jgi:hypothetical protein
MTLVICENEFEFNFCFVFFSENNPSNPGGHTVFGHGELPARSFPFRSTNLLQGLQYLKKFCGFFFSLSVRCGENLYPLVTSNLIVIFFFFLLLLIGSMSCAKSRLV